MGGFGAGAGRRGELPLTLQSSRDTPTARRSLRPGQCITVLVQYHIHFVLYCITYTWYCTYCIKDTLLHVVCLYPRW